MKQHLKSLGLTLVTAGIFFALLVGAQFFFKNFYIADHFHEKLTQIEGVNKVDIKDETITLTMSDVSNIKKSYQEITAAIQDKKYRIQIIDMPSKKLEEAAEKSEIAIQEGIFRGNFTEMSEYIRELSQSQGITVKIYLDNEKVYLHMREHNKYLYRIIDRPVSTLPDTTS